MRAILGDEYNPCPLIRKRFLAGEIGKSAGKGFYDYNQNQGLTTLEEKEHLPGKLSN